MFQNRSFWQIADRRRLLIEEDHTQFHLRILRIRALRIHARIASLAKFYFLSYPIYYSTGWTIFSQMVARASQSVSFWHLRTILRMHDCKIQSER